MANKITEILSFRAGKNDFLSELQNEIYHKGNKKGHWGQNKCKKMSIFA